MVADIGIDLHLVDSRDDLRVGDHAGTERQGVPDTLGHQLCRVRRGLVIQAYRAVAVQRQTLPGALVAPGDAIAHLNAVITESVVVPVHGEDGIMRRGDRGGVLGDVLTELVVGEGRSKHRGIAHAQIGDEPGQRIGAVAGAVVGDGQLGLSVAVVVGADLAPVGRHLSGAG
uniref:hypothetical protein n=1 Tax=Propionibacterium freudenreichii TaxID=1744 RepID=UPI0021A33704|nr:hypothetical protein [Propionibacterium freudenreichii]